LTLDFIFTIDQHSSPAGIYNFFGEANSWDFDDEWGLEDNVYGYSFFAVVDYNSSYWEPSLPNYINISCSGAPVPVGDGPGTLDCWVDIVGLYCFKLILIFL